MIFQKQSGKDGRSASVVLLSVLSEELVEKPKPNGVMANLLHRSQTMIEASPDLKQEPTDSKADSRLSSLEGFVRRWTGKLKTETELQTRMKRRITEKIEFKPPTSDYYDGIPVKPGLLFFETLSRHCDQTPLQVNIPDVLIIYKKITWLNTVNGRVKARKEFHLRDFVTALGQPSDFTTGQSCAAIRVTNERGFGSKVICLNWKEFNEKVSKLSFPQFGSVQKFIPTAGGQIVTLRLFYQTKEKASKAVSIKLPADCNRYALSTETGILKLEVTDMNGHVVDSLSTVARRLIAFLQYFYYIRFESIVLDFIKDVNGVIWLINCKGFRYDVNVSRARLLRQLGKANVEDAARLLTKQEVREEKLNSLHCKLCLLPYRPLELDKVLSFKMLLLYKHHTAVNNRSVLDLSHLRASAVDNLSHTLRVCEICFMLVVNECELLKTESRLAHLLLIPEKELDLTRDPVVTQPNLMPDSMSQWRLLILFVGMDIDPQILKEQDWWLQYEFLGGVEAFQMCGRLTQIEPGKFSISLARLHYIFALRTPSTKDEFCSTYLKVRLTRNEKWSSKLSEGSFCPFHPFTFDFTGKKAAFSTISVLLFNEFSRCGTVTVRVAFSCDEVVAAKKLPVSIRRFGRMFVPEESYITSQPLPEEWMELFVAGEELARTELLSSRDEVERMYSPALDIQEELEQLNHIHPPKTTPLLQRMKTRELSTGKESAMRCLDTSVSAEKRNRIQRCDSCKSIQKQLNSFDVRHMTPSPGWFGRLSTSSIAHNGADAGFTPDDTENDLRALSVCHDNPSNFDLTDVSTDLSQAVSNYLKRRPSSVKTIRLLKRAESYVAPSEAVTLTQSSVLTESCSQSVIIGLGNSSVELLSRPNPVVRLHRKRPEDKEAKRLQMIKKGKKVIRISQVYARFPNV